MPRGVDPLTSGSMLASLAYNLSATVDATVNSTRENCTLIEDRSLTDRVSNPGVNLNLDLQSHESYGNGPYTCKRSRSKVTRFKSYSGNGRTDVQKNGRTNAIALGLPPVLTRSVKIHDDCSDRSVRA